jgi:hypothetical protein
VPRQEKKEEGCASAELGLAMQTTSWSSSEARLIDLGASGVNGFELDAIERTWLVIPCENNRKRYPIRSLVLVYIWTTELEHLQQRR